MTAPALRPSLNARPLHLALYFVALAFAVPTLLEFLLVTFPYRFGVNQVRYGAVGLLFNTVMFPLLVGLTIGLVASVQLGHRKVTRTLAVIALLFALILLAAAPLFVLDFLQLRASVNPQMKRAFDYTSAKAGVTGGLMFLTAAAIGIAGWRSVPPAAKKAPARGRSTANTVVVGGSAAEAPQA